MSNYTQVYLAEYTGLSELARATVKDQDELKIDFATFVYNLVEYNQRPIDERLLSDQHTRLLSSETQLFGHFTEAHLDKIALTENKTFSTIRKVIENYVYNEEEVLTKQLTEYSVTIIDLIRTTIAITDYVTSNIKSGTREHDRMSRYLTNIIVLTNKLGSAMSDY